MWGFVAFVLFVIAAFLIFWSARRVERQREEEEITRETLEVCPRCGNELTKILIRTGGAVPLIS